MQGKGIWRTVALVGVAVVGVIVMTMTIFSRQMHNQYEAEVRQALALQAQDGFALLTEADIATLPVPVQRYLAYVGALGKPKVWDFRAEMSGRMRNDDQSGWMQVDAKQYNFFENPVRMFYIKGSVLGIPAYGLHAYKDAQGSMLIKALGVVPVVDQKGVEMNRADTVTLLNDMALFAPATLIDPRVAWQELDEQTVIATMANGENVVSATLSFAEDGRLTDFYSQDRFRGYERTDWSTPVSEYAQFGDYRLPTKANALWHLPDRAFSYAEFDIDKIEYNVSEFR